jgi:hypothetical protein
VRDPVAAGDWIVKPAGADDADDLLGFFQRVFGVSRSKVHWAWQFGENPYGGPLVSVARRRSDGRVIGSLSGVALRLNHRGSPVVAALAVDGAVLSEYRGQHVFGGVARLFHEACAAAGVQAVVGFPNPGALVALARDAAWSRILDVRSHRLRLSLTGGLRIPSVLRPVAAVVDLPYRAAIGMQLAARHAFLRRLVGPAVFRRAAAVPAGYEALWNAWKNQEVLSVWKDAAYFAWRYDRNPDHRFTYFTLEREGQLAALAVGVELDRAQVLCELVVGARDVAAGRLLVTEIARTALGRGLRAVSFLGHDAGLFDEVFAGFARTRSFTNVFGGRVLAEGPLAEDLPRGANWTVTFGDGDFV